MHKLGLSTKVKAILNPAEGYPKIIASGKILQGEVIETVSSHDISFTDASTLCDISKSFLHCVQPNPIKLQDSNERADELYKELISDLLKNGTPDADELEKIKEDPRIIELFHRMKWMDVLIGHIPYYLESPFPNCAIKWNESTGLWQVIALTEILPDEVLTILQKSE
jgi:hypothetical protein